MERRLAAIAFLDVAGYSRLMGADEDATLRRWEALRRGLIEPRVADWRGRVVDRAGDGLFVEFRSASDALGWAAGVQAAIAPANADGPELRVRIALHLGDVIDGADGAVHGDGVNTGARLQAFAEPGRVIASKAFVDALPGEAGARFADLGDLHLKNIARPVRAFGLRAAREEVRRHPAPPGRRPDPRPSIAVLPFRGDGTGPDGAYFADGVIEGIIHVLASLESLFVISRGSTLGYAGAAVDPRAAGRALGVRYVLHGSVRRSGGGLRIGTELTDAETGAVIRSDRHEGAAADLFELQDRISVQAATAIAPHLRERELARAMRKHPDSMDSYDLLLQALDHLHRLDPESFHRSRGLLQRAMADDPDYAPPHSYAAWWHVLRIAQGWSPDPVADSAEAGRLAAAAIERDRNDALALALHGHAVGYAAKDFATATLLLDRALASGPNCALAWTFNSLLCGWLGDGPNAVSRAEHGLRLSPFDPFAFLHEHVLSQAHYVNGDFDAAVFWGRQSTARNPRHAPSLRTLVASLVAAGRRGEVCDGAQRLLAVEPSFGLRAFAGRTPLRGALRDRFVDRLREAGLPD